MKTKSAIAWCLGTLFLIAGCDDYSGIKGRQSVIEEVGPEVLAVPKKNWCFIARDAKGAVWYVETSGWDGKITAKTMLFPAWKQQGKESR
jgi:hypothetical protein